MNVDYKQQELAHWTRQKAHNWLICEAFNWLREHSPQMLGEGLDERQVHYGVYLADYPWVGRAETFSDSKPQGSPNVGACDDELAGHKVGSDCVGIGNDFCVELRYWKKINLYLNASWAGHFIFPLVHKENPLDQIGHYSHTSLLRLDGTSDREDYVATGPNGQGNWGVKGDIYATQLLELARSFWPGMDPAPDMSGLLRVWPGNIRVPGLFGGQAKVTAPQICLGSNPYVNHPRSGPTWPVWVPDSYSPQKLLNKRPPRSKRTAAIYLGWALHLLHDLAVPFHAVNRFGDYHTQAEDELDDWIHQGNFNHLPVTSMSSMGGATEYRFNQSNPYLPNFYDELARPNFCRKYSSDDYGRYSVARGELVERLREVARLSAPYYEDVHPDKRKNKDESLAAWEYVMDIALKHTIMMVATVQRNAGFTGKVLDKNGIALGNVQLTFKNEAGTIAKSVQSNVSGVFMVALPELGNYAITASLSDGTSYTQRWYVLQRGGFRPLTIQVGSTQPPNGVQGTAWLVVSRTRRVRITECPGRTSYREWCNREWKNKPGWKVYAGCAAPWTCCIDDYF